MNSTRCNKTKLLSPLPAGSWMAEQVSAFAHFPWPHFQESMLYAVSGESWGHISTCSQRVLKPDTESDGTNMQAQHDDSINTIICSTCSTNLIYSDLTPTYSTCHAHIAGSSIKRTQKYATIIDMWVRFTQHWRTVCGFCPEPAVEMNLRCGWRESKPEEWYVDSPHYPGLEYCWKSNQACTMTA